MAEALHDIEIRNLYKIFGPNGAALVDEVKAGVDKEEMKARHDHVIGLNNINLTIPAGRFRWSWGCRARASRRSSAISTA